MLIVFAISLILSDVQRGVAVITHFRPGIARIKCLMHLLYFIMFLSYIFVIFYLVPYVVFSFYLLLGFTSYFNYLFHPLLFLILLLVSFISIIIIRYYYYL